MGALQKPRPFVQTDMPCSYAAPLPISWMFFSHNESGPDFPKQTMLWGLSPPKTLCQFQSGLKYDSIVCASLCYELPPLPAPPLFPLFSPPSSTCLSFILWQLLQELRLCKYDYWFIHFAQDGVYFQNRSLLGCCRWERCQLLKTRFSFWPFEGHVLQSFLPLNPSPVEV